MNRRHFLRTTALAGAACLIDFETAFARGMKDPLVGQAWHGWRNGQFQIHFIYTDVAESMFMFFMFNTITYLTASDESMIVRSVMRFNS